MHVCMCCVSLPSIWWPSGIEKEAQYLAFGVQAKEKDIRNVECPIWGKDNCVYMC